MSKGRRELSSDEKALWKRVVEKVKPRRPRRADPDDEPAPAKLVAKATAQPKPAATAPARRMNPPPPADRSGEKRVRRGRVEIGATLDLHGHTQDSARATLARFLRRAQSRGYSTVIVVTGMGRGGEGVLKRRFPEWLAEREIHVLISGYAPAHRSHGGAGAFYVFIKRAAMKA